MKWLKRIIRKIPNKLLGIILGILMLIFIIVNVYFIYTVTLFENIENLIRYGIIAITIIVFILMCLYFFNTIFKNKIASYFIFILIILLMSAGEGFLVFNINKLFSTMQNINKEYVTYATSLVTLKDSEIKDMSNVKDLKIGIISDTKNIEGYIISQDIIKEYGLDKDNEIVKYDSFSIMLNDLYEKNVDALFLSSNYKIMFSTMEDFENIDGDTKVITTMEKKMVKQGTTDQSGVKKLTEPFTILLIGVQSTKDGLDKNAAFNGDALTLITFNPTTLNATMLSIPRDTYVPIMCFKNHIENKITHAGWNGESCIISTIENFTGIDIDYYMKINFKGVVKLVDALGGVEVDVPYSFCEQDSNRDFGKHTIYLEKGLQTLNGEEALALSRNRKYHSQCAAKWNTGARNDFIRGQNQQLVINAIANKMKTINSLNQIYKIMDTISNNIDTNLTTNQILSFYDVGKDMLLKSQNSNDDLLSMQRLYLSGYIQTIYDDYNRAALSNVMYYRASLKEVVDAMEINLGIKKPKLVKEFAFSIDEPYTPKVIGKGSYKKDYIIETFPNFVGSIGKDKAINWCNKNGYKYNFITIDQNNKDYKAEYKDNQIIKQSVPAYYRLAKIDKNKAITFTIVEKTDAPVTINCSLEENYTNTKCLVPNFVGWTLSQYNSWKASAPGSFIALTPVEVAITDPSCSGKDPGIIVSQTKEAGTKIIDIADLGVSYCELAE